MSAPRAVPLDLVEPRARRRVLGGPAPHGAHDEHARLRGKQREHERLRAVARPRKIVEPQVDRANARRGFDCAIAASVAMLIRGSVERTRVGNEEGVKRASRVGRRERAIEPAPARGERLVHAGRRTRRPEASGVDTREGPRSRLARARRSSPPRRSSIRRARPPHSRGGRGGSCRRPRARRTRARAGPRPPPRRDEARATGRAPPVARRAGAGATCASGPPGDADSGSDVSESAPGRRCGRRGDRRSVEQRRLRRTAAPGTRACPMSATR